jgi:exodeoxyribonuclease-3
LIEATEQHCCSEGRSIALPRPVQPLGIGKIAGQRQLGRESQVYDMKIATFNVNNVNKRLDNVITWLRWSRPDVACLQELKCTAKDLPVGRITKAGYDAVWRGQNLWNGVAILGRGQEPVLTRAALPDDPTDSQMRYLEAAVGGVLIATLYAPNGNPQPGPKFDYKLAWMKRLLKHAAELVGLDAPVVLAGDFNVVPTEADIYPSKSYANNALVQPEPRALFRKLLQQGWIDAIREIHPDEPMYTFWDYRRNRWERDAGLRLDHLLLNAKATSLLTDAGVDREVRGLEGASDHAPAWINLRDAAARARKQSGTAKSPASEKDSPIECSFSVEVRLVSRSTDGFRKGLIDEVPSLEGIEPLYGRSVHHCPYCDGFESRDERLAVYGSGDKGAGLALMMKQWSSDVVLFTDGQAAVSADMVERLKQQSIEIYFEQIARLEGTEYGALKSIRLKSGRVIERSAMFFSTGSHQRSKLSEKLGCARDDKGGIVTDPITEESSVPGVYVAGDASRDVLLVAVAIAEGAKAAVAINRALLREDGLG